MADVKISALPAATIPLDGTEVLPIVQGTSTVKVANNNLRPKQIQSNVTSGVLQVVGPAAASTRVMTTPDANFTAARTDAAQSFTGDQTLTTGNLVIGTSGKGIDFSATPQPAGMTSELLADYEEGTWTPVIRNSGGTLMTLTTAVGKYRKIGNQVTLWFTVISSDDLTEPYYYLLYGMPYNGAITEPTYIGSTYTYQASNGRGSTGAIQFSDFNAGAFILRTAYVSGAANLFSYSDSIYGCCTYYV